jgi:4'-phosphopantetheinyl transferase
MIHWLIQSASDYPELAADAVLAGWLHPAEQAKLATLKTAKRRQDRLLGRLTAKQLIQTVMGGALPLTAIEIHNGDKGDPVVNCQWSMVNGGRAIANLQSPISNPQSPISLSISHSRGHAFCAVVERPFSPLGADLEWVEARLDGFAEDYFTAAECERVNRADEAMRDVLITAVWSAKEAALKALHLGLTVDTRAVECLIEPVAERPLRWLPFSVRGDNGRLPHPAPALTGWWRTWGNFVLTVVAEEERS